MTRLLFSYLTPVASAPTNIRTVQESLTSTRVFWTPSTQGDTTGYIISYTGGSSGSVTVSDPNIDNYLLTGLVMETRYTISIVATSEHLPSDVLEVEVTLGKTEILCILHDSCSILFFLQSHCQVSLV